MLEYGILKRKRDETQGAEARTRRKDGGEAEERSRQITSMATTI